MTKEESIKELKTIPWIGKASSQYLYDIGIRKVTDLKNRDPEELYFKSCAQQGRQIDRCWLYVIRCAVYYASHEVHNPAMLKWNFWSDANLKNNVVTS